MKPEDLKQDSNTALTGRVLKQQMKILVWTLNNKYTSISYEKNKVWSSKIE